MILDPDVASAPARILIVDDEPRNRQLLEAMLTPEGYVLLTAGSGEEALAIVDQQPPDLILLDVMMSGMDGYDVTARIKGDIATKNIPVIMVTDLDDRKARMLGLSAGAEDFLTKPVDRAELRVRVRNLLRLRAAAALEQIRRDQMRFKDEFLSHVSHELRSPLTAIKQFTTILLGGLAGELNAEQREYQQIVLKNIHQLQSMIDDLLEVTRLETGKLTVDPESASVSDAVADTFNTLQGTAHAKGVALACDLAPNLPSAYADQTRLRQILIILFDNAIKFTPSGGAATLRVKLMQDSRFLLLEVADTGCGISAEAAERIFERLYQVSEPIEVSRRGLGLGLYICKELVTRQGGTIWVTSLPPNGCVFSFTLPVFSLDNVIAPLLKNHRWPAESVAIVVVEASLAGAWPSKEYQEDWTREARGLLQRCLLPDLDVLLPRMGTGAQGGRFFVAAFADEKGASVLANRIREQFDRLPPLKHGALTLDVSYSMLEPYAQDFSEHADDIVSGMARHLEDAIKSQVIPEAA